MSILVRYVVLHCHTGRTYMHTQKDESLRDGIHP